MLFYELLRFERVNWAHGGADVPVVGLSLDSRTSKYGTLFFCIRGAHRDGHEYVMDAYRRGCRHFVAEHTLVLPQDASVLVCSSVRRTMAVLAARYYGNPEKDIRLVGVTGTKGKTTTALMMQGLLERCGVCTAYIGSSGVAFGNTHISTENTTPPSLDIFKYLRMIADYGIKTVVMEVSSQALATDRVYGLPFSTGIFTNLSKDHIGVGEHADMEEYRSSKMKLFTDFCPKRVILNSEESFTFDIMKGWKGETSILYGNGPKSLLKYRGLRQYKDNNYLYTSFVLDVDDRAHEVVLRFGGAHYVLDFLAALSSAALVGGVPYATLLPWASTLSVPGRCEVYTTPSGALVVIDYAHNGASLGAALSGLRPYTEGRLFCLFGAVGERTKCRRFDMAVAAERYADFSVITSDNPGSEDVEKIIEEIHVAFKDRSRSACIPERDEAIRYLLGIAGRGDVVLLAGKGNENYQLSAEGKTPFCERKIVEEFGAFRK